MKPQPCSVRLEVMVTDHRMQPVRDATVELRREAGARPELLRREGDRYVATLDEPGPVELRVTTAKKGWSRHDLAVVLRPGDNRVNATIAPKGTPFYRAAQGARVYFRAVPDRLWLHAEGPRIRPWLAWQLATNKLRFRDVGRAARTEVDTVRLELKVPATSAARARLAEQLRVIVEEELPRQDATGRLTVQMLRPDGVVEGLSNDLIVRFQRGADEAARRRFEEQHGVAIRRALSPLEDTYVVRRRGLPGYDILKIVDKMRGDQAVVYVEPDVVFFAARSHQSASGDFLFPEQPDLALIGTPTAWATSKGSPAITVAVVDVQGVDGRHGSLAFRDRTTPSKSRLLVNWDFSRNTVQAWNQLGGDHGTQCAATAVGAALDTEGTAGVATDCGLIGARLPASPATTDIIDAWMWAAGFPITRASGPAQRTTGAASVLSNSWGIPWAVMPSTLSVAIDQLTTVARGGKGCVICFSVGNFGYVPFGLRSAYAADPRTIAVGASIAISGPLCASMYASPTGAKINLPVVADTRAYYSPYGPELDLVAPSHASDDGTKRWQPIVSATRVGGGNWIRSPTKSTTVVSTPSATRVRLADVTGFAYQGVALFGAPGAPGRAFRRIYAVNSNSKEITVAPLVPAPAVDSPVSTGPADFGDTFGGTSHAAAMVAGAAALLLSVYPQASWWAVRNLLCSTAVKIDKPQSNAIGQWLPDTDGRDFSQWYGYGRLDLAAAVDKAKRAADGDTLVLDELATAPPVLTDVQELAVEPHAAISAPVTAGRPRRRHR